MVFFDGVCGMCNRFVDFLLRHDGKGQFLFAPLQGETAKAIVPDEWRERLKSVVYRDEEGLHRHSGAVVRMLCRLGGGWALLGYAMWVIPAPIRDLGYAGVAAVRYRLFGKKESCRMPKPAERERFLD
nr:DCC1-like thiol-disulfide oxidoreductase family protein [Stratiformator vulcanicus]